MTLALLLFCRLMAGSLTVAIMVDRGIDRALLISRRVTRKLRHAPPRK
jgi:hypothetical protein